MKVHDQPELHHVLVTGGAGYLGSVLVPQLLGAGHRVRVLDLQDFATEGAPAALTQGRLELVRADVRDAGAVQRALAGVDAVVHLAAVVGDGACAADPDRARGVNLEASRQLVELAGAASVRRFVFASTCSIYGRLADGACAREDTAPHPLSLYAETKVAVERLLLALPRRSRLRPVCLRFATAYGLSPRTRFDLTVNEFTRTLSLGQDLAIYGPHTWRPYCHTQDLMRAVVLVLKAPEARVSFQVFNVGDTSENYTKQMILDEIRTQVRTGTIHYVRTAPDQRDYRVVFDKLRQTLGYRVSRRVSDGIREIHRAIEEGNFPSWDETCAAAS